MSWVVLLAEITALDSAESVPVAAGGLSRFGIMLWPLLAMSAAVLVVTIERLLYFHRVQIHSGEFLNGVRNVLKSNNVVEAIAICDATPGPVARLTKAAIVSRDSGRDRVQEAIEEVGLLEVPKLERNLALLATLAQIAPLAGLFGTMLGFIQVFKRLQATEGFSAPAPLFAGVWQALYAAAGGLAIAIVAYAAYNYLVSRINAIVLDMEKASGDVMRIVLSEPPASRRD